ncbi:methyltransferase domain-containing protein [Colletotrichum plurivorum]|uniref:Methyltransferase domain-containing protein n=1 Tax=Colletotrichum plurivorum TaxID=2175906 RepID=A0A8H6K486_9PEZI|nr:methyltransferase domain-containing protein [Colletotrichum plurivorum]
MRFLQPATWLVAGLACGAIAESEADVGRAVDEKVGNAIKDGVGEDKILASMPVHSLVEIHEVTVTLEDIPQKPSPRHEQEKKNLLKRMSKSHGKWDTNHPRSRLLDALFGYSRYKPRHMAELDRWRGLYKHVSKAQKKVLENTIGYSQKFETAEQLLDFNQALCDEIVDTALEYYGISHQEFAGHSKAKDEAKQLADRVSVSQALKHYVRDWSTSGRSERDDAFPCILGTLQTLYPERSTDVKVLLPGAGIGRLGHEVAALGGFGVTVNEWSMFMNLAYRFLEAHPGVGGKALHPFVDSWSHHATTADMFRGVSFPDVPVNASSVLLVEGDFVSAFKAEKGLYDSVVTHFFIDTARNVMSYFDTIHALLKTGGYWVNFGPLLWGTGPFVQLSLDEIVAIAKSMGFEFVDVWEECGEVTIPGEKVRGKRAVYGFNDKALTRNSYEAQCWVARKVR